MFANWLFWTIFFMVWLALAFWPARVADRKGHSFFGYFVFSLFFFPASLITAYLVEDRSPSAVGRVQTGGSAVTG